MANIHAAQPSLPVSITSNERTHTHTTQNHQQFKTLELVECLLACNVKATISFGVQSRIGAPRSGADEFPKVMVFGEWTTRRPLETLYGSGVNFLLVVVS